MKYGFDISKQILQAVKYPISVSVLFEAVTFR